MHDRHKRMSLQFLQIIDLDRSLIWSRACARLRARIMEPPERFGFVRPLPMVLLVLVFQHLAVIERVVDSLGAVDRSLLSVELFSGEAAISNAVREMWGLAGSFDKRYHVSQDLATEVASTR